MSATVDCVSDGDGTSYFYLNQLKSLQLKADNQQSRKGNLSFYSYL